MITEQRADKYREQAIKSVAAKAKNPAQAGIACVEVTPHDLLELVDAWVQVKLNKVASPDDLERSGSAQDEPVGG